MGETRLLRNSSVQKVIQSFLDGEDFAAIEIILSHAEAKDWVQMRTDPPRFRPQIFIGSWANPKSHPKAGEVRILRVMTGPDSVTRAIARQGKFLYCYPWI